MNETGDVSSGVDTCLHGRVTLRICGVTPTPVLTRSWGDSSRQPLTIVLLD